VKENARQFGFANVFATCLQLVELLFFNTAFDVLNHTNFGLPTAVTTNAAFGTIRNTYPAT
jgi:hypothetical protein